MTSLVRPQPHVSRKRERTLPVRLAQSADKDEEDKWFFFSSLSTAQ